MSNYFLFEVSGLIQNCEVSHPRWKFNLRSWSPFWKPRFKISLKKTFKAKKTRHFIFFSWKVSNPGNGNDSIWITTSLLASDDAPLFKEVKKWSWAVLSDCWSLRIRLFLHSRFRKLFLFLNRLVTKGAIENHDLN